MTTTQPGMQQKRDAQMYFLHLLRAWLLLSQTRGGWWPEGLVLSRALGASSRASAAQADWAAGDRFTDLPHKSKTLYLLRGCLRSVEEFRIPANLSWFIIVNFPTVALLRPVHWGSPNALFQAWANHAARFVASANQSTRFLASANQNARWQQQREGQSERAARFYVTSYNNKHCAVFRNKLQCN